MVRYRSACVLMILILLLVTPFVANAQSPPSNHTIGAKAFPPAVDTPIKHAPRPIIGALREPLDKLSQIETFQVIGYHPLPNPGESIARGRNDPIGIARDCLYVGNRVGRRTGTGAAFGTPALPPEALIVDIGDPSKPQVVGAFTTPANATSRELRTIADRNTLIIMNFRDTGPDSGLVKNYQIYDISDCRNSVLRHTIDLGTGEDHVRGRSLRAFVKFTGQPGE